MKMYTTSAQTAPDQLEERRVYRFKARNFSLGVWNGDRGEMCGFIGLREKFWYPYPFTEYHCDTGGQVGTVWNIEPTEHFLPEDIEVAETFDSRCGICEGLTVFEPTIPFRSTPGRQHHIDKALDADHDPHRSTYVPTNWTLMKWLAQFEEDEEYRAYVEAYANATTSDERAELHETWRLKAQAKRDAYWKEKGLEI